MQCSQGLPLRTGKRARPEMSGRPCPSKKWSKGQLLLLKSALGRWIPWGGSPPQLVWGPRLSLLTGHFIMENLMGCAEALSAGLPAGPFPWLHQLPQASSQAQGEAAHRTQALGSEWKTLGASPPQERTEL